MMVMMMVMNMMIDDDDNDDGSDVMGDEVGVGVSLGRAWRGEVLVFTRRYR